MSWLRFPVTYMARRQCISVVEGTPSAGRDIEHRVQQQLLKLNPRAPGMTKTESQGSKCKSLALLAPERGEFVR